MGKTAMGAEELVRLLKAGSMAKALAGILGGSDPNGENSRGERPLGALLANPAPERKRAAWLGLLDALLAAGADPEASGVSFGARGEEARPLGLAAMAGDAPAILRLLEAGADPRRSGGWRLGKTPGPALAIAAWAGEREALAALLSWEGPKGWVDAPGEIGGMTPLMRACAADALGGEAAEMLLEAGADWAAEDRFGRSAPDVGRGGSQAALASWREREQLGAAVGGNAGPGRARGI